MACKYTFVQLLLLLLFFCTYAIAIDKRLRFNEDGTFKVVQFTDLHYGYNEHENEQTEKVQERILEEEKPDLVIITGDLISGYEWDRFQRGWFKSLWERLISPMVKRNIRWAVALGNHDVEGDLDGNEIVELEKTQELSLTQQGPSHISGATNYYLPIYSYDSANFSDSDIGQILWVFDSGSNGCLGVKGWGCIMYDQVAWYRNTSRALATSRFPINNFNDNNNNNNNRYNNRRPRVTPIPSLAFFHIPLYEHLDLWNTHGVYGDLGEGEGVCCSSVNTGLYAAIREMGDIQGVYCGHDHSNDYIGDYHGISLGFGRKTGYGCYGPPLGWKHGARVLEITHNKFGARTWLRLEDGSIEVQKQNSMSWRKFLGCCSMEGHGRVSMTWVNILSLFLYVTVIVSLVSFLALSFYRKRKGKPILPSSSSDNDESGVVGKFTSHLWGSKAPRPRLRRVNELENV